MRLTELQETFQYHASLNPAAWAGLTLKPQVRLHLLRTARHFIHYLDLPDLRLSDVILVGSNANYNWNSYSDFDVHVVADFDSINCDLAEALFKAKKDLWNIQHDITIYGYDVELYVQNVQEQVRSQGQFSLLHDTWLQKPTHNPPRVDDHSVMAKTAELVYQITQVVDHQRSINGIDRIQDKIRQMRKSGLADRGEFSVENLAFKNLRNGGYLAKLNAAKQHILDRELSL